MSEGFWTGKTPCWKMHRCPPDLCKQCPATRYPQYPCWAIEGTYCKYNQYTGQINDTRICQNCDVYREYGRSEPIEIQCRPESPYRQQFIHHLMEGGGGSDRH